MSFMSIDFRGISSQAAQPPVPVFHGFIDNSSAPVLRYCFSAVKVLLKFIMRGGVERHGLFSVPFSSVGGEDNGGNAGRD